MRPLAGRLYEPVEAGAGEGVRAWIFPANLLGTFERADPEDLIAVALRPPHGWRLRRGAATLLGLHEIERRSLAPARAWHRDLLDGPTDHPLVIHRAPIGWLRAGCRGVVVLDWRAAAVDLLGLWTAIVAEDVGHGLEIRRRLTRPWPARRSWFRPQRRPHDAFNRPPR